jgi:hypothetical protein
VYQNYLPTKTCLRGSGIFPWIIGITSLLFWILLEDVLCEESILLWFPVLADEFFSSLLLGLSRGIGEELAAEVRVFREVSDEVLGPVRILDPVDDLPFARRDFDVRRSIVLVAAAFAFRGLRRRA